MFNKIINWLAGFGICQPVYSTLVNMADVLSLEIIDGKYHIDSKRLKDYLPNTMDMESAVLYNFLLLNPRVVVEVEHLHQFRLTDLIPFMDTPSYSELDGGYVYNVGNHVCNTITGDTVNLMMNQLTLRAGMVKYRVNYEEEMVETGKKVTYKKTYLKGGKVIATRTITQKDDMMIVEYKESERETSFAVINEDTFLNYL